MLALIDSGKLAYKYGDKRGGIAVVQGASVVPVALACSHLGDVLPAAEPTVAWLALACLGLAALLFAKGAWWAYTDAVHGAYIDDAKHYRKQGW